MIGVLDRVWRALGILPERNDTSAHAAERSYNEPARPLVPPAAATTPVEAPIEIPDVVRAQIAHALRGQEAAETARVLSGRAALAGPPLPAHVPVRPAFRPGVTPLECPGCGLVFGDDVMTKCWTCHRPGEPIDDAP